MEAAKKLAILPLPAMDSGQGFYFRYRDVGHCYAYREPRHKLLNERGFKRVNLRFSPARPAKFLLSAT